MKNNTISKSLRTITTKIVFSLTVLFSLISFSAYSTHIVGGELNYKCLGNNLYEIHLRVYRDCYNGVPPFDNPAAVGIFDANNKLVQTLLLPFPGSTVLPPTLAQKNPCVKTPTNICVEVAEYVGTVTLPPRAGGYQLAYQRCCRNNTIANLVNPANTGATYYAVIPDQAVVTCNSNPVFKNWPPIFVCANNPIVFDHSATDGDGDSIYYDLCSPFTGATNGNSQPNPPAAPPYTSVTFKAPYSATDPMGGIPLSINSKTGLLVGIPNTVGQFVVGVCATEFRNGVRLSTTKRDFQFNVVACQPDVVASFATATTDCTNHTVTFTNNSTGTTSFFWKFGDPIKTPADTSHLTNPTWTYSTLGTFTVTLIAFHSSLPQCNDTATFTVKVDTCQPCGMTLNVGKVDATCGVSGPCTPSIPVLDTQNGKTITAGTANTTITWNHTVTAGGTNRLLIVQLSSITYNAISVTCGGTPMTLLTQSTNGIFRVEMWYLLAPPTGINTIVADYGPGAGTFFSEKRAESFSFTSVNQTTPFGVPTSTIGSACPATFTTASGANELVIDMIAKDYFYPPTVDGTVPAQTQKYSRQITFNPSCGGSLQTGAAPTVTSSWTWQFAGTYPWAACAVSIKPACGAGGPTPGSATVTAVGGTAPFTYTWSTNPPQTGPTANNLTAGTYTVTVLDKSNCVNTASVIIDAVSTIAFTPSKTDPSTCGSSDGTASVGTVTGNNGPVTYQWTPNVSTGPTASNLSAGTYTIKVVDSAGCSKSATLTLGQPTIITETATKTDVRCKNGFGTAIAGVPTGGSGTYTYSWSTIPVQNTQTAINLKPGYYVVTATDGGGCSGTAAVTVLDSSLVASSSSTNVSCYAGSNGTATISASLGTPGYTYSWNTTPVQTTPTAVGLKAGVTYTGIVTDNAGCKDTVTITLTQPTVIVPEPKNTSTVACAGATNGSAEVFVSGGTAPYTYQWCNGSTLPTASGLPQGKCFVTVTDSLGCSKTDTVNIIYPPVLNATTISSNILCFGTNTGAISANTTGGLFPYTYTWNTSPVQTTPTATNLPAGTYTVIVTDSIGCTATASAVITQPTAVNLLLTSTNVTCPGANDGTATVSASGGTPTYTYSWTTSPVQTTPKATNLPGGTYTVTVVDANNCNTKTTAVILDVNPSPVANYSVINVLTCDGMVIDFYNSSSSATSYLWIFGDGTTSTDKDPEHTFKYGTSTKVSLIAKNGICVDTLTMDFNVSPFADYITPQIPNVFTPNGDLNNDVFEIKVGNGLEYCVKITIYDRWGLKMYDNFNGAPWDGRTKAGKAVPDGTYFYLLEIGENDPKEGVTPFQMHGALSLIR